MQAKSLRLAMAGSRGHHRQLPVVHNAFDQHHTAAFLAKLRTQLASPTVECLRTDARHRRHVVTQWAKDDKQMPEAPNSVPSQPSARSTTSVSPSSTGVGASDATAATTRGRSAPNSTISSKSGSGTNGSAASSRARRRPGSEAAQRIKEQQRLLRQLLGTGSMSSMSSVSSVDAAELDNIPMAPAQHSNSKAAPQQPLADIASNNASRSHAARAVNKSRRQPSGLYDDASAADYDPLMLDLLGFTSVAQYLQYKLDTAVKQAKVDSIGAVMWGTLAFGVLTQLGGHDMYMHYIREVTMNGSASDNLVFLWVYILGYFTVKSCFMSLATGWRAMSARKAEQHKVQELEKLEKQHQRLAFWQLQEKLERFDNRANRTFTELSLSSLLLGLLIFMKGGLDDLALQMETVDAQALCGLLIMMWIFWETYFASIGAVVQLVTVATHFVEKWQHKQKWEREDSE